MKTVPIAAAQVFWGDDLEAPVRQVERGPIDYLMLDCLAEVTMSILQKYEPEHYELLRGQLAADPVKEHLGDLVRGPVERCELPNLHALNFLLHQALDGGGPVSLMNDAQGKVGEGAEQRAPAYGGRGAREGRDTDCRTGPRASRLRFRPVGRWRPMR